MQELEIDYEVNLITVQALTSLRRPVRMRVTLMPANFEPGWEQSPYVRNFTAQNTMGIDDCIGDIFEYIEETRNIFTRRYSSGQAAKLHLRAF